MSIIYGQAITLGGGSAAPAIFGDGSDGVGLFTSNTTWNADTEDTGMIVKNFESLVISEGVTISAGNRNCGMIIRVKGDCTINGTLANKLAPKSILDSDGVDFSAYPASMLNGIAGNGGSGGAASHSGVNAAGAGGTGMTGRFYGGGYSAGGGGAGYTYGQAIKGGAGGSVNALTTAVTTGLFVGGAAYTAGINGGGGGGAANRAGGTGAGAAGVAGGDYAGGSGGAGNYGGGVIILLVGGNLTFNGTIDCSGGAGGAGGRGTSSSGAGGGGGGGGGGRIFICHKGSITNSGTLNVNGGAGGARGGGTYPATAGTAGSIGTTAVKTYEQYMEEDVA